MIKPHVIAATFTVSAFASLLSAQTPAKIDFARDVQPIFRQSCVTCHGPSQQMNGLRLDRKSSVLSVRRVVPGGLENSLLYKRLLGASEYGSQMPPTGALRPEQIDIVKRWIEQGADWPDALANEVELPPLNPKAIAMVSALRSGDQKTFNRYVAEDENLLNARGPAGATPFMYAVLYSDAVTLERLLNQGADPNKRNDAQATALMWAATDLDKTRVLLNHGADVNARSDDFRTPLMVAATRQGNIAVVKLLIEGGANVNPNPRPADSGSPLVQAGTAGDAEVMQLLIEHGANVKDAAEPLLVSAITNRCAKCFDLVIAKNPDKEAATAALMEVAPLADVNSVRVLLDHGADVNAFDPTGRTPLMYAAVSDLVPLDVVKLIVERGADINAINRHKNSGDAGLTVLDIAKFQGNTSIVEFLTKAGAKTSTQNSRALRPIGTNTLQAAIQRSIPLLQRNDSEFTKKAGCISCHNDSLEAMATGQAQRRGFHRDEEMAARQVQANISHLERFRDRLYQGVYLTQVNDNFGADVLGYILLGLDAERYKPDLNTDAAAMYIKMHQMTDGHWEIGKGDSRPPLCALYIGQTVLAMRALQLYAPKTDKAAYGKSIQMAADWIAEAEPVTNDDLGWRLIGLAWSGKNKDLVGKAMKELLAIQQSDGGWSDLQTTSSNAYATGRALVALQTAGLPVSDPAYQRGVQFLLNTQQEDGSWYVRTRALGFQPYFDNGFPYAVDQWISSAGTSWATMALTLAAPSASASASGGRGR